MPKREIISTPNAPAAIGTYSQAVRCGDTMYVSGQIPIDPATGQLVDGPMEAQIDRAFDNLEAIVTAAGGTLANIAKLNVFLVDLGHFAKVNAAMQARFAEPFPARAAIGVASLPRGANVEVDAIVVFD